jgi:hypothetical protein
MTWVEAALMLNGSAALLAAVTSVRNGRKIDEVHKATNSMKDELVAATQKEAFAAGQKNEKEKTDAKPDSLV